MRFIHLSDLHIGKRFHFYNLLEDQKYILEEILTKIEEHCPDAVLISGDIYDKAVPSAEAVTVFDDFLSGISQRVPKTRIFLISGNHDSAERLAFASRILEKRQIHMISTLPRTKEEFLHKVVLKDEFGEVCFYFLPFLKPGYVRTLSPEAKEYNLHQAVQFLTEREGIDRNKRNVLLSHQFYTHKGKEPLRSDSETWMVGGIENIDVSLLDPFDYVALGHLHRPQWVGRKSIRYCGSPLKYSLSEKEDKKSITLVTLEEKGKEPLIEELPLIPLRDVKQRKGTSEEFLAGPPCEDYIGFILTDEKMPYQIRERLEERYSHILEIKVENNRIREELSLPEREIRINPREAFEEFYEEIHGVSMTAQEKEWVEMIFKEAEEEEA
ncbi:exonuclease sbcCD subunit D [Blautia sp. An249]|uniref:exonuclease SbcCD subunit D n=1 Tax=Blautia sp. An249 TaxID=1965603 RepID=UPI000B3A83C1|nr:exonuclease SbcCD subunit D [Blautia sp. An249]OUO78625.1 exonuclease sbcCD subunit D [Blautia sp. An249]